MYDMDLAQFQKEIAYIYTLHRCQIHNSKSFPAKTWGHFWTGMWVYQQCMQLEQHSLNIDFKHIHTYYIPTTTDFDTLYFYNLWT